MSTESIQQASVTLFKNYETFAVHPSLTNGSGAEIFAGQEVFISGDREVSPRNAGAQIPIGVCIVGAADGDRVSIRSLFYSDLNANAAGAIAAGVLVRPDGTRDASGRPNYVAAATGELASGIVIVGTAAAGPLYIGLFKSLIVAP